MRVEHDVGAPGLHRRQRGLGRADDRVAGDHEVGLRGVDLGRVDRVGRIGDLDVAPGRAALLREAAGVLRDHALALEVRGHAEQLADRDHAGAADAGDDDAPGALGRRQRRLGHRRQVWLRTHLLLVRPFQGAALDGDEARAEALDARVVEVAGVLVDAPLAAELGLDRLDAQAVALHAAVAAALADPLVDDHAPVGRGQLAALAAAPLLGRAGLVVDDDGGAADRAELALEAVELVAVVHGHAGL